MMKVSWRGEYRMSTSIRVSLTKRPVVEVGDGMVEVQAVPDQYSYLVQVVSVNAMFQTDRSVDSEANMTYRRLVGNSIRSNSRQQQSLWNLSKEVDSTVSTSNARRTPRTNTASRTPLYLISIEHSVYGALCHGAEVVRPYRQQRVSEGREIGGLSGHVDFVIDNDGE